MGSELRRLLKLWWIRAGVACFAYLCLVGLFSEYVLRIETLWPWAWPWSGRVVFWLLALALLVLIGIFVYVLVYHMVGPSLASYVNKGLDKRTAKAKEKFADGLMNFSTAICSATFIAVLVFPLTVFMQAIT